MTELNNIYNGRNKNRQCITGGIFYCRDIAGFNVSASNKLLCILTEKCSEIGNKNIPPTVVAEFKTNICPMLKIWAYFGGLDRIQARILFRAFAIESRESSLSKA